MKSFLNKYNIFLKFRENTDKFFNILKNFKKILINIFTKFRIFFINMYLGKL